jgi:hypothetical protein
LLLTQTILGRFFTGRMHSECLEQGGIKHCYSTHYCDDNSFRVLCELKTNPSESARALVPHGFEHIAREAKDTSLREAALAELQSMMKDPSSDVQNEVREALVKVHQ